MSTTKPPIDARLHPKHLNVFMAVCAEGSAARAGERVRRAPSAVSRSIEELEAMLGVPLFERTARGMLATEFGKVLHKRVQRGFDQLSVARQALEALGAAQGSLPRPAAPVFSLAVGQRRLDILAAFAERQQVSTAARSLQVTQPAISMALRDWESSVGVALFDRTAAGVSLNDAGRVLLLHVRRSLAELRLAAAEIAAMKGVLEGHVTVGALPFARPYMLPVAIAGLLARHPTLSFSTIEGTLESLTGGLRSGDIDLVVGALRPTAQDTEFVREELFAEHMAVIARRGHPLLAGTAGSALADAARYAWILPRAGSPTRDALGRVIELLGTSLRVAVESSDLSVIRGLLLESDLLTAASPHLFHHELVEGLLQTLPIELPATSRPIGILRRTHDHSSPAAQLLIEEMRRLTHVPGDVPLQAAD